MTIQSLLITDTSFDIGTAMPQARIISEYRPRILIVEIPPNFPPENVVKITGVQAIIFSEDNVKLTTLGDPHAVDTLSSSEKLFVRGWCASLISGSKTRPGDKLSWDSPGFKPPR